MQKQCTEKEMLISKLEGVFTDHIYNNSNQIRYPMVFNDGSKLKGKNTILNTMNLTHSKFYSSHYIFGANKVYIYEAIDAILNKLDDLDIIHIDSIIDAMEDQKYNTPIKNLHLSARSFNVLDRADFTILGELVDMDDVEIKGIKNLGTKSFTEIIEKLEEYGFR